MSTSTQMTDLQLNQLLQFTETSMLESIGPSGKSRINQLVHYHLESGGRRVRAKLALTSGIALGLDTQTCISLAASCELVHNASLLHDDIQDNDTHRRGREAAWHKFDTNAAMCAGTLMLSAAFGVLSDCGKYTGELISHLHRRTAGLIHGQALDLKGQAVLSDTVDYIRMAAAKSGSLLALPVELALIAAQRTDLLAAAAQAGECFAVAYQIADDISDFEEDLRRGNCNIISLLMSKGRDQDYALAESFELMNQHLLFAKNSAALLPAGSGDLLLELSNQLGQSFSPEFSPELKTSCEQI